MFVVAKVDAEGGRGRGDGFHVVAQGKRSRWNALLTEDLPDPAESAAKETLVEVQVGFCPGRWSRSR